MIAEDSHRGYKVGCPSCGKNVLVPVGRFEDGCVVGDFVIRGKIGEGSIGAVYRAVQISLDRIVALKILSPEYTNAKGVNDFLREAARPPSSSTRTSCRRSPSARTTAPATWP
jgi:serine/threonine protein kinase